jgi:hypothetical protein
MDIPDDGPSWDIDDFDESEMMAPEEDYDMLQEMIQDQEVNMVSTTRPTEKAVVREEEITKVAFPSQPNTDQIQEDDMAGGSKVTSSTTTSTTLPYHINIAPKSSDLSLYSFSRYQSSASESYRVYKTLSNTGASSDDHAKLLLKKRLAEERRKREGGGEDVNKINPKLIAPGVDGLGGERKRRKGRGMGDR